MALRASEYRRVDEAHPEIEDAMDTNEPSESIEDDTELLDRLHEINSCFSALIEQASDLLHKAETLNSESIRRNNLDADEYEEAPFGEQASRLREVIENAEEGTEDTENAISDLSKGKISIEQASRVAELTQERLDSAIGTVDEMSEDISNATIEDED